MFEEVIEESNSPVNCETIYIEYNQKVTAFDENDVAGNKKGKWDLFKSAQWLLQRTNLFI